MQEQDLQPFLVGSMANIVCKLEMVVAEELITSKAIIVKLVASVGGKAEESILIWCLKSKYFSQPKLMRSVVATLAKTSQMQQATFT